MLREMTGRNHDEYVALHPWVDPWNWVWENTYKWDEANANWDELDEREPDIELICRALELSEVGDYSEAMLILTSLAEQGSVRSMIELGKYHEFGYGVPLNLDLAEIWYQRALDGGSQYAMLKCADFAALRQNYSECDAILQPGVDNGWASAAFWQARYCLKQCDSKQTYRRIFPLLTTSAKCGHPGSQLYLANFMVRGKFGILRVPIGFYRAVIFAITELPRHRLEEKSPATR